METYEKNGLILIISSPSGAGKTTVTRALLKEILRCQLSISYTTRPKRKNETEGQDYYFVSQETFKELQAKKFFAESAFVFGYYYGTSHKTLQLFKKNITIILDIDWQGARKIYEQYRAYTVKIFLLPPNINTLKQRLEHRSVDSQEVIQYRMAKAQNEITHYNEYSYVLINDNLQKTVEKIKCIVSCEQLKLIFNPSTHTFVKGL